MLYSMDVTLLGIDTEARLVHPVKASPSIVVTEFGMVIVVSDLQFPKAMLPILVTELGMVTDLMPVP